ncbi:hypothetical protein NQ176_g4216 [Zarea fungicola]|uniref:Uncharacterized protein n=1 Tax=Zarea fungicola TaxID=93591 RepID=A0ACC1NEJ2_9HYPO|nr:hypothetical protein NQ176_g4216 [Lecanicillium fungicola]
MSGPFREESGFPRFCELPNELRIRIWEMTVEPRRVPVSCWIGDQPAPYPASHDKIDKVMRDCIDETALSNKTTLPNVLYAASPLKPAILDVCQQSRAIALGIYTALELTPQSGVSYAWVQLDMDTVYVDLSQSNFLSFWHVSDSIRRLEFEADIGEDYWCWRVSGDVLIFDNLVRCVINTNDDWIDWDTDCGNYTYRPACSPENLWIRKIKTGEMRSGADIDRDAVIRKEEEETNGVEWNDI